MNNTELIEAFFTAFAKGNAEEMITCYHKDVTFQDPAFGTLKGDRAKQMWQMLLSQKSAAPVVSFSDVISLGDNMVGAKWRAKYFYGPKKRKVINHVKAVFTIKDVKIHKHTDSFNLWKWSRQAIGPVGLAIGWTPMMKAKIQSIANGKLDSYINKVA